MSVNLFVLQCLQQCSEGSCDHKCSWWQNCHVEEVKLPRYWYVYDTAAVVVSELRIILLDMKGLAPSRSPNFPGLKSWQMQIHITNKMA